MVDKCFVYNKPLEKGNSYFITKSKIRVPDEHFDTNNNNKKKNKED